jgi:nitroreductase
MNIQTLIRNRRSVYPKTYTPGRPIEREIIEQLLESANWAPTHRMTEPWRFQVFHSETSRTQLGRYLVEYYEKNTPESEITAEKKAKMLENPLRSGAVIAICMQRSPENLVPEWEELAAVACAVQNMWLVCTEMNLGCYWSSPSAIIGTPDILQLQAGETCLGLFYLGWHQMPQVPGKRTPVEAKTIWL